MICISQNGVAGGNGIGHMRRPGHILHSYRNQAGVMGCEFGFVLGQLYELAAAHTSGGPTVENQDHWPFGESLGQDKGLAGLIREFKQGR